MSSPSIAVAMLTYNRSHTALRSLKSVASSPGVCSVTVFDDGSDAKNLAVLEKGCFDFPNVRLVKNPQNLGYCKNLIQALRHLASAETELVFLCESDMLLADGWVSAVDQAFKLSNCSVAMAAMLHQDQITPGRSASFQRRCLEGVTKYSGSDNEVFEKMPFGSCYTEFPDEQPSIRSGSYEIWYTSNSVGTIFFRRSFLLGIIGNLENIRFFPEQEDAWICWACFAFNRYSPKSLMVLDPGLALTIGENGLNGAMRLNNVRWSGNVLWRNNRTAKMILFLYWVVEYANLEKLPERIKKTFHLLKNRFF